MMKTQGILSSMEFSTESGEFEANFTYNSAATAKSVAYLNEEYWYPSGAELELLVEGKLVDMASVDLQYVDNYCTFDLSLNDKIPNGASITFRAVAKW